MVTSKAEENDTFVVAQLGSEHITLHMISVMLSVYMAGYVGGWGVISQKN